jgi:hypothetical protein
LFFEEGIQNGDLMNIHFRDVQTGMVEARAVIEIEPGVFLNEVTLLNIDGQLVVEFPRKNFIGKNERTHHLDIITFESEDKQVLWEVQIKQAYRTWRKENRKVLVYEDKPAEEAGTDELPRRQYQERSYENRPRRDSSYASGTHREHNENDRSRRPHDDSRGSKPSYQDRPYREKRSFDDKPRVERSYSDRKPREYADRDSRPRPKDRPSGDKPESRERPYSQRRSFDDKPPRERAPRADKPAYDKPYRDRAPRQDKPAYDKPARERSTQSERPKRTYSTGGTGRPRSGSSVAPKTRRPKKQ